MKKLALLSMGVGVIPNISSIVHSFSSNIEVINFVDDGIIRNTAAHNDIIQVDSFKRLLNLLYSAELSGADALLVTCSSISEFVDLARPFTSIPLFKIDEPMVIEAISRGRKIGVAATVSTTLSPSLRLVKNIAEKQCKEIELIHRLISPAFAAFQRGEIELHDNLIFQSICELCDLCDVVLLAQASMMSVIDKLDELRKPKVLSSPYLGVKAVVEAMGWL